MNTRQPDNIENYKMRSSRSRTRSQLSNEKVFNKIFTTLKKAIFSNECLIGNIYKV